MRQLNKRSSIQDIKKKSLKFYELKCNLKYISFCLLKVHMRTNKPKGSLVIEKDRRFCSSTSKSKVVLSSTTPRPDTKSLLLE